jgi:hypothetical protein
MLQQEPNRMNWPKDSHDLAKPRSEKDQNERDRSTICVGRFPERNDLQLWRCFGTNDEIYRSVCGVRTANGTSNPFCGFDPYSYHYALMDHGRTVGAMTITRPDDGVVDCEAYYPQTLLNIFREDLLTSCRFMMLPTNDTSYSLLRWMTTSVWRDHVSLGCRAAVINAQSQMVPFYRRMGFRILDGFAFTHPALATASQVMTLRADPQIQPYFRDAFEHLQSVIPADIWDRVLALSTKIQREEQTSKTCGKIYSYAAGSSSMDPEGFRVVNNADGSRIGEVCQLFPQLARFFCDRTMIVVAYPATLGLTSPGVLIDTYVHPPTFIRSLHLAAIEERPVVVVAQPLVGADFILRAIRQRIPLPNRMLWASGGYFLPESLERFVRDRLRQEGCELEVLHCYGTAEVGHSLFAAVDRLASGRPHYCKAAAHVATMFNEKNNRLTAITAVASQELEDEVRVEQDGFDIIPHPSRLSPSVFQTLESWKALQWSRWTGFVADVSGELTVQCRQWVSPDEETPEPKYREPKYREIEYHEFFARHGGSSLAKPPWGDQASTIFDGDSVSSLSIAVRERDSEPSS